jgi:polyisoprenyl-phosphate glycosyltransferase
MVRQREWGSQRGPETPPAETLSIAIVVPVFQGEHTLEALLEEIAPLTTEQSTPGGARFRVTEVLLVHDGAADRSDLIMRTLADRHPFVALVWLSRNYGQHAATLAGMAGTSADWVVTLDEDGQQNPDDIGRLLDHALASGAQLVYGLPVNPPPHSALRNALSKAVKTTFVRLLGNREIVRFNSFRLVLGEIARGVAAYCGESVYLDVAFRWVVGRVGHCPVTLRPERGRPSGYSLRRLVGHFWHLVLTSGTRPLRAISLLGVAFVLAGTLVSGFVLYRKLTAGIPVAGWTSMVFMVSISAGLILFALGIIAEYLGIAVSMAMGKPLYMIVSGPASGKHLR